MKKALSLKAIVARLGLLGFLVTTSAIAQINENLDTLLERANNCELVLPDQELPNGKGSESRTDWEGLKSLEQYVQDSKVSTAIIRMLRICSIDNDYVENYVLGMLFGSDSQEVTDYFSRTYQAKRLDYLRFVNMGRDNYTHRFNNLKKITEHLLARDPSFIEVVAKNYRNTSFSLDNAALYMEEVYQLMKAGVKKDLSAEEVIVIRSYYSQLGNKDKKKFGRPYGESNEDCCSAVTRTRDFHSDSEHRIYKLGDGLVKIQELDSRSVAGKLLEDPRIKYYAYMPFPTSS